MHHSRYPLQHHVTNRVPVGVVHQLKVIEVQQEAARALVATIKLFQEALNSLLKKSSRKETSQMITSTSLELVRDITVVAYLCLAHPLEADQDIPCANLVSTHQPHLGDRIAVDQHSVRAPVVTHLDRRAT